jgi:UDP-2,3-diacylglucosamine hydrolase
MSDSGILIHFFTGNHDIWTYGYLEKETGMKVCRQHVEREINGRLFFIGHGDGIGPGDRGYKMLKGIFTCHLLQRMFSMVHPDISMRFGKWWSKSSRYAKGIVAEPYKGDDKEIQVVFAAETLKNRRFDYFIFGHRHIPYEVHLGKSKVVNLGDWITYFTYAVWDGIELELHSAVAEKENDIFR